MDHILPNVPTLIAALPQQYGDSIPARALVLLLVKRATTPGYYQIETAQCLEPDDPTDIASIPYTDHERWALTASAEGMQVIAIIIDADADGVGDSTSEHNQVIDKVSVLLQESGRYVDSAYAARTAAAGSPVWSLDRDTYLGTVPEPVEIPQEATAIVPEGIVSSDLF